MDLHNKIALNCDMGESFGAWKMGDDEQIIPYVQMVNLACGFHASDPVNMDKAIKLTLEYDVLLGAHISYPDLVGFGRRSIKCTYEEIEAMVLYQLGALGAFCKKHKTSILYVKPHGALYHDMIEDMGIFEAILKALNQFEKSLMLMVPSSDKNDQLKGISRKYITLLLYEAFLDRNYNDDGSLVPRSEENAVIHDINKVARRAKDLKEKGYIKSINGKELTFKVDTVCIHGDNENALKIIKKVEKYLP